MPDQTPRLGLPWLMPAQAQKHVTVNESLGRLDALVQISVVSQTQNAQPSAPTDGQAYILPAGASGTDWDGFAEHDLAYIQDGAWRAISARTGMAAWVEDESAWVQFDGTRWAAFTDAIESLANLTSLGVGTSPDANNPFAAKLNAALWTAEFTGEGGTGDLRYTLNKQAPGNVLSLLFQSAWSGRAELGLTGSDDVSLKVSADGSTWTDAFSVARSDGTVSLPKIAVSAGAVSGLSELSLQTGGAVSLGPKPQDLVRRAELGSAAGYDAEAFRLIPVAGVSGAVALNPDALGRALVKTGAGAITLPARSDVDAGWQIWVKNRSGAAVDLTPLHPDDAINDGTPGVSLSLADGSAVLVIAADDAAWEVF